MDYLNPECCSGPEVAEKANKTAANSLKEAEKANKIAAGAAKEATRAVSKAEKDQEIADGLEEKAFLASEEAGVIVERCAKERAEKKLAITERELAITERELGIAHRQSFRDRGKLKSYAQQVTNIQRELGIARSRGSQTEEHKASLENYVSALTTRADSALEETVNLGELLQYFIALDVADREAREDNACEVGSEDSACEVDSEDGAREVDSEDIDNSEVQVGCVENFLCFLR